MFSKQIRFDVVLIIFIGTTQFSRNQVMLMEDDCVFCGIIANKKPSSIIYSDDKVIAFMVIRQINPGHSVVISKIHAPGLTELDEETGAKSEGINLFLSDGKAAAQEIFHVHLHVVPRFFGDGFGIKHGPKNFLEPSREELDEVATIIKNALQK